MSQTGNSTNAGTNESAAKPYMVRHAIYDRNRGVHAYELIFDATSGESDDSSGDEQIHGMRSARAVLDAITDIDVAEVADNQLAFINLSLEFLATDQHLLPNSNNVGIDVPCPAEPNSSTVPAVQQLTAQGFTVALDDFNWYPGVEPLLDIVDLVKIDIATADLDTLGQQVEQLRSWSIKLVAMNVETQEIFDQCLDMGFDYFEGPFLCKPRAVNTNRLPDSKVNTLRLMSALQSPDVDAQELDAIISKDLTLHYRLLRTVNSTYYGLRVEVKSVAHAVTYLGIPTIRRWASLQLLAGSDDKPSEVLRLALIRARMCEQLIANLSKEQRDKAFTAGLFSLLDGAFDTPMALILEKLPLDQELVSALTNFGGPYGRLLQTIVWYETGNRKQIEQAELYSIDQLSTCYLEALGWAQEQFSMLGS